MTDDQERGEPPDAERYPIDERQPSVSVVEAIADARDVGATVVDPLARSADPSALDALYGSFEAGEGVMSIAFGYGRCRVRVTSDGMVTIGTRPDAPSDGAGTGNDEGPGGNDQSGSTGEDRLDDYPLNSVALGVVETIAERTDQDPVRIGPPLDDVVDPQALDRFFQHETFQGSVRFEYGEYRVTIVADEEVAIHVADR